MHIVDLLKDQRRPATGRFALYPRRARLLEAIEHLTADFSGYAARPENRPAHAARPPRRAAQKSAPARKGQQQRGRGNIFHNHAMKDPRQQPGLGNDQQTANDAKQAGNHQPATGDNALLF
jgi:hypothetical protein